MSRVSGALPFKNHFIGRALVDALTTVQLEKGPPHPLSLLESARFFETWSYSKELAALTSGRV